MGANSAPPAAVSLDSLPNEVFVQILSPFTTRELLPLTTVSHRFYALVLRLLHYRLLLSASLTEYKLILECYHPTSKLTEPHVFCIYLGTPGLSDKYEGEGSLYENIDTARKLGRLGSVYSIFKPVEIPDDGPSNQTSSNESLSMDDSASVKRSVDIEGFEDFSQLCVIVSVVKVRPGTHRLQSVVEVKDGVIRLFRDWLKNQAVGDRETTSQDLILWADRDKNVGLKFRVREAPRLDSNFPVLVHRDEETFSSYDIVIEELHVRTTRLLLAVEQSVQEQENYSKAVVFTTSMG